MYIYIYISSQGVHMNIDLHVKLALNIETILNNTLKKN